MCFSGVASCTVQIIFTQNYVTTKISKSYLDVVLTPLDVIDLGDMGFGVSPSTLYCTLLCMHSINIMLQPSILLAGRRREWPCFQSASST